MAKRRAERRRPRLGGGNPWPPAVIKVGSVAHDGGETEITFDLLAEGALIVATNGGPETDSYYMQGVVDGVFSTVFGCAIKNVGPVTAGQRGKLSFAGLLDNTQNWCIGIPANTQMLGSPNGGRIAGTLQVSEGNSSDSQGFVRLINTGSIGEYLPLLCHITTLAVFSATEIDINLLNVGSGVFVFVGIPPILIGGIQAPDSVTDLGGGVLRLEYLSGWSPGSPLSLNAWSPSIRTTTGQWVAPFYVTLP